MKKYTFLTKPPLDICMSKTCMVGWGFCPLLSGCKKEIQMEEGERDRETSRGIIHPVYDHELGESTSPPRDTGS